MKRKVIATILGIAASAAITPAFAQGSVYFQNYYTTTSALVVPAPVTYNGQNIGSDFTADLLYSLNGGVTWIDSGATSQFYGTTGGSPTTDGAGIFPQVQVNIGTYISGSPVQFMEEAYNGSSYANATIRGLSGVVIVTSISSGTTPPATMLADNPLATTPLTAFTVAPVPEPTTLALAGLGGLASLVALRRKQA